MNWWDALARMLAALWLILAALYGAADPDRLSSTLAITERDINDALPLVATNLRNVYVDLVPGGAVIRADVPVRRRSLSVAATGTITVQNGTVLLYVTRIQAGGVPVPASVVRLINAEIVPAVNSTLAQSLEDALSETGVIIQSVTIDNETMIVEFSGTP